MNEIDEVKVACESIIHFADLMQEAFENEDLESFFELCGSLTHEMSFIFDENDNIILKQKETENIEYILYTHYKMMFVYFMIDTIDRLICSINDEEYNSYFLKSSLEKIIEKANKICELNIETEKQNKQIFTECFNELMRVTT